LFITHLLVINLSLGGNEQHVRNTEACFTLSCNNHHYPHSENGNYSSFVGHIDTHLDYEIQENFMQFFLGKMCILLSRKYSISEGLLEVKRYSNNDLKNQLLHSKMVMLKTKTHLYNIQNFSYFLRLNYKMTNLQHFHFTSVSDRCMYTCISYLLLLFNIITCYKLQTE